MGDETQNNVNLDLNLDPLPSSDNEPGLGLGLGLGLMPIESVSAEVMLRDRLSRLRETFNVRAREGWWPVQPQLLLPQEIESFSRELPADSSVNGDDARVQSREGSDSSEERNLEVIKACENNATRLVNEDSGKNKDEGKGREEEGSLYDCNICFDLATEPVVTCCGHLFCWPCIYRWLHFHSDAKECPVCKGEVTTKSVTPIYGRGSNNRKPEKDPRVKIPIRPRARRIENWRQTIQRNAFAFPMEEMIRRIGGQFEFPRDMAQLQPQNTEGNHNSAEGNNFLLHMLLTSRGMRTEQNMPGPFDDLVDANSAPRSPSNSNNLGESQRFSSLLLRRPRRHRATSIPYITSALSSAERLVQPYHLDHHIERNQEQPQPVDDRESMSSIAAVVHSESRTVDTNFEIDSRVGISTSSSGRTDDVSRASDVDSRYSRAYRRRRLS